MNIFNHVNELATMAFKTECYGNLKKDEAQTLIAELATQDLTEKEREFKLARLYTYFTPASPKKPKTDEQWIGLAMAGKKDIREYLQFIKANEGDLVATDGHRLHLISGYDTEDNSWYDKSMNSIEGIEYRYPDYKRVIPDTAKMTEIAIDVSSLEVVELAKAFSADLRYAYKIVDNKGDTLLHVNKKYLDQALSGLTSPTFYINSEYPQYNSLLITDSNKLAVIMPIRP